MYQKRKKSGAHYILKNLGEELGMTEFTLYALKDGGKLPSNEDVKLLKEHGIFKEYVQEVIRL